MEKRFNLLLLAATLLTFQFAAQGDITIEGTGYIAIGRTEAKRMTNACGIMLEMRDKEYRITTKAFSEKEIYDQVISSDGLYTYRLDQNWPSFKDKQVGSHYSEDGEIHAGVYPHEAKSLARLVWWVYYAPILLQAGTNHYPIPPNLSDPVRSDDVAQVVSFSKTNPPLLDEITCYAGNTVHLRKYDSTNDTTSYKDIVLKAPFDKGYIHWHLQVTGITNIGKTTIPLSFDYEGYATDSRAATNSLYLEPPFHGHFVVTNFYRAVHSGSLLPVATLKNVHVSDWTHFPEKLTGGVPVIDSKLNGNNWQSPTNAHALKQVREIQQSLDKKFH